FSLSFFSIIRSPTRSTLFPYTTLFRSFYSIYKEKQSLKLQSYTRYIYRIDIVKPRVFRKALKMRFVSIRLTKLFYLTFTYRQFRDRKSTRLNSSHVKISYAVFCLKKKK